MSGLIALFGVLGLARLELARDLPSLAIRAALGAGPRQLVGFRVRQILPFSVVGASFGSGCVLLLGDTVLQPGFGEGLFTISVAVGGGITALFLATILGLAVPMRALARTNLSSVLRNPQG
jgi:ABC-type antimicrobial peptide transport system permease subunit